MLKRLLTINWQYAIGEVIIVIIGITIAFSLNSYKDNAKNKSAKKEYIESLIVDLSNEEKHLQENIQAFEVRLNTVKQLSPFLYGRKEGRDSVYRKVFDLARVVNLSSNDITYKTLINSGDLSLFKSFELRKALENHYTNYQIIEQNYQRQHKINEKYFADFMIYEMNYETLRKGDFSFMDSQLLRNIIQSLNGTYMIALNASKNGIEESKLLREKLEKALEKL